MKEPDNIKEELLEWAFDYFCKTIKCNGLNSDTIRFNYPNANLQEIILELLEEDSIGLIADEHDINYSIIRKGFAPKEQQIDYIKKNGVNGNFCIFPSKTYLIQHYVESDLLPRLPFNKMLKLGTPHNKVIFFEWGVLFKYYSDPRYHFYFSDYSGSITSSDMVRDELRISLRTFGVGKNKNGCYVVAVPLSELATMPSVCQIEWYGMLEPEQDKCKTLQDYLYNLKGNWNFNQTVFRSIVQEITNINHLTKNIWKCQMFKNDYAENKPLGFDMLYLPTKYVFYDYVSLLEKIVVHNLNAKFFDSIEVQSKDQNGNSIGPLGRLKIWLSSVNQALLPEIHTPLYQLRRERGKPAHEVFEDEFSMDYFKKQEDLSVEIFNALNLLKSIIQTHPNSDGIELPYHNTQNYYII